MFSKAAVKNKLASAVMAVCNEEHISELGDESMLSSVIPLNSLFCKCSFNLSRDATNFIFEWTDLSMKHALFSTSYYHLKMVGLEQYDLPLGKHYTL